jgi:hypothetical protein
MGTLTRNGLYDAYPYGLEAIFADVASQPMFEGINFEFGPEYSNDPGTSPKVVFAPAPDDDPDGPRMDSLLGPCWLPATTDDPLRIPGTTDDGTVVYLPKLVDGPPVLVAQAVTSNEQDGPPIISIQSLPRSGPWASYYRTGSPIPERQAILTSSDDPLVAILVKLSVRPGKTAADIATTPQEIGAAVAAHKIASRVLDVRWPGTGEAPVKSSPLERFRAMDTRLQGATVYLWEKTQTQLDKLLNLLWFNLRRMYGADFLAKAPVPMEHESANADWGYTWPVYFRVPIYSAITVAQVRSVNITAKLAPASFEEEE